MLTRLEVDGFKNLLDFAVDLGPFTCVAGENGVGKSNFFDAVQFLALLADGPLMDAAHQVRGPDPSGPADLEGLFWGGPSDGRRVIRMAAEMIVPRSVEDDFGTPAEPTSSYLRYEVHLGLVEPTGRAKVGRIELLHEALAPITQKAAAGRLARPLAVRGFRESMVWNRRRGAGYISTETTAEGPVISLHQDGGGRGRPRRAAPGRASSTVVATTTSGDDPTVLAVRREMQSWRRLALEPSAMRTPDGYHDPRRMDQDGAHLAATLHRIAAGPGDDHDAVLARVASYLDRLCGLRVDAVEIDEDDARQRLSLNLVERGGLRVPARNLSEGTLRFLALCVLLEDPTVNGLLCLEEPENGIHPANVPAMIDLVQRLAIDPTEPPGPDEPVRQVIINTHSPVVVQSVTPDDLLFASTRRLPAASGHPSARALHLVPMSGSWRAAASGTPAMTRGDVLPYLTQVPGTALEVSA